MAPKVCIARGAIVILPSADVREAMGSGMVDVKRGAILLGYPPGTPQEFVEWLRPMLEKIAALLSRVLGTDSERRSAEG